VRLWRLRTSSRFPREKHKPEDRHTNGARAASRNLTQCGRQTVYQSNELKYYEIRIIEANFRPPLKSRRETRS